MIASPLLLEPAPLVALAAEGAVPAENSGTGALCLYGDRGGKFREDRPAPLRLAPPVPPRALRNPRWLEERRPLLLLAELASAPGPTREVLEAPRSARCDSIGPRLGPPRAWVAGDTRVSRRFIGAMLGDTPGR
jgi:hypothetical protein